MIANARFRDAGAAPGLAAGWTLRSVCQAEQIAAFGPRAGASVEAFSSWGAWAAMFPPGTVVLAMFSGGVALEHFDWPVAAPWTELSGGVVAGATRDAFEWTGAPLHTAWTDVATMGASFVGSAREAFETGWAGLAGALAITIAEAALVRAPLHGGPIETFESAWTPNPTLR